MDIPMDQPKRIYLQPWCEGCEKHNWEGRQWCEDDPWGPCDECGAQATVYELSEKVVLEKASERERCAQIAEGMIAPDGQANEIYSAYTMACHHIADRIRNSN